MYSCLKIFVAFLVLLMLSTTADALAPDSIVSKRYNYEVRCTC